MSAVDHLFAATAFAGPMEQFEIVSIFPFGTENINLEFTNASLWMLISVLVASAFMFAATNKAQLVPGRMQSAAEMLYQFIANMLRDATGGEGMKFFPYIFTLFVFIFLCNLLGLLPTIPGVPHALHVFTPTSHIIVTFALAMVTFLLVIITGFYKQGFGFLKMFVPTVPLWLLPLITVIEVLSFLSRPISLSIRLFANMLAGHLILKLFAGFVVGLLAADGLFKAIAIIPLLGNVGVFMLEILVAFLQAYVFAMLSCIYLNDAVNEAHH